MRNQRFILRQIGGLLFLWATLGAVFLVLSPHIYAANPSIISFQGKVVNADGTNVVNGTYSFSFVMFDDASLGTESDGVRDKWHELSKSVTVTNGVFQTNLGSATALPNFNTLNSLYLAVKFNGDTSGTNGGYMTPRIQMASVPYALNADNLGGLDKTGFIQNGTSLQSTSNFNISGTGIAGTALQAPIVQTAAATDLALQPATGIVALNKASTSNELRVYENAVSPSNYASITATSTTATFKSNSGTTQIGNGIGAITLNAGTSAAINITGHAASVWQTDAGSLTIQGGSTLSLLSTTSNAASLDSGSTGAVNIGNGANSKAIAIGNSTSGTTVTSTAGAVTNTLSNTGNTIKTNTDSATAFQVQNTSSLNILTVDTANKVVYVGSQTSDANQVLFQLDSFSTLADTASCTTTVNQGALYYNTNSNAIRACINGGWEDLVSTASLGMQLFGVVPDSGSNPGDLAAVTGVQNGPCKVSVGANTTTVSWTACTAYSGGRKVIVTAGTAATTNAVANNFQHLCLTTSGTNQPALSTTGAETANLATVSLPSVSAPILCLADIKFTGANNTITQVYDTRTYTTTLKETASIQTNTAVPALGLLVQYTATKGVVQPTAGTANLNDLAGVIVATTGATSTSTINGIIATSGPAAVKVVAATAIGNYLFSSTTSGYAVGVATKPTEGTGTIYNLIGKARTVWAGGTACSANTDACAASVLTSIDKR